MVAARAKPRPKRKRKRAAPKPPPMTTAVVIGRPTVLDEEVEIIMLDDETVERKIVKMTVHQAVLDALEGGADRRSAFEYVGVPYSTGRKWLEKGKKGERTFATFATDFERAEARAAVRKAKQLYDKGDALAWLQKRRREEWGPDAVVVEGVTPFFAMLADRAEATEAEYTRRLEEGEEE